MPKIKAIASPKSSRLLLFVIMLACLALLSSCGKAKTNADSQPAETPVSSPFNAVETSSPAATSVTRDYNSAPGNVRECLETKLTLERYRAISQSGATPTPAENTIINNCFPAPVVAGNMAENVVNPPQGNGQPPASTGGNSPANGMASGPKTLPDELKTATGDFAWCFEQALGSDLDAIKNGQKEPDAEQSQKVNHCRSSYSDPKMVSCKPTAAYTYTYGGKAITHDMVSGLDGFIASPSAVRLNDGRVRVFFGAGPDVRSAISTKPVAAPYTDISFTVEDGVRMPSGYGNPRVIPLPDGQYRMFARGADNASILSFTSTDALNMTEENGIRITKTDLDLINLSGMGITKLGNTWKLYVSDSLVNGDDLTQINNRPNLKIKSATSTDMLNWTVDDGIRLGAGSTAPGFTLDDRGMTSGAEHPTAVTVGNEVLLAFRGTNVDCLATSTDGVTFDQPLLISDEKLDGNRFAGGDIDMLKLDDETFLLTGSGGGPTVEGHIRMGILRKN